MGHWYAVKLKCLDAFAECMPWLIDLTGECAEYSSEFGSSVWFDTVAEARTELGVHGLKLEEHQLVRVSTQPDTNHFAMVAVDWS